MSKLLVFCLAFSFTIYPAMISFAQEETEPEEVEVEEVLPNEEFDELMLEDGTIPNALTGTVSQIDAASGSITVSNDEDGEDVTFKISEHCYILIDGNDATTSDIQPGDQIYLEDYIEEGEKLTDWIEVTREAPAEAPAME